MIFVAATCPSCGGSLQVPDDREKVKCMYCGGDVVINEQVEIQIARVGTYLELARTAEGAGNSAEAYKYYSLILESDPQNLESWIGKGVAAGWQSTLAVLRTEETATCIEKALSLGLTDPSLISKAAQAAERISVSIFEVARNHFHEFKREEDLEGQEYNWQLKCDLTSQTMQSIRLLSVAWSMQPSGTIAQGMITMCRAILDLSTLKTEATGPYVELMKVCERWGRENGASFQSESGVTSKTGCFVATAAFGSASHPAVSELRFWRDEWLAKRRFGGNLIRVYNGYGPMLARALEHSPGLRLFARWIIIYPSAALVRRFLKRARVVGIFRRHPR